MSAADVATLWSDTVAAPAARAPLPGDAKTDVAIVGAGFTGLWTAYYLTHLDPRLSITVLEARSAGFGASGRNGGWCTASLAGLDALLADPARRAGGLALQRAMFDAVDEVGRVCATNAIDCHYAKGGSLYVAVTPPQRDALAAQVEELHAAGLGAEDDRWLDAAATTKHLRMAGALGAVYTPHCAALHPLRLVQGLAAAVEQRGVRIHEQTPVHTIAPGRVETARGTVTARTVVRATEAYTCSLRGHRRDLAPIHSLMIATEPLPPATWAEIGLERRETFGDGRRIVIYGQRTSDDRLAFGARGDYRFGSRIENAFQRDDPRFEGIRRTLTSLFPVLESARITHRWGGALGVPRNWRPAVGIDRATGLAWGGGYVGQGVAASNLAGRTLAELIVDAGSERCALPWVGAPSRRWEPEPLRWLAATGLGRIGRSADEYELATGRRPRLRAGVFDFFVRM